MALEKLESSKKKSRWGGKRLNAGRSTGSKNQKTIEDDIALEELRQRVLRSKDKLLTSQMSLAQGIQMLYKIEKDTKGNSKKPELVTSTYEIEDYLAGEYDKGAEYYFITTARPDNKAIDSLFDRVFGKSIQRTELTGAGGGHVEIDVDIKDTIKRIYGKS